MSVALEVEARAGRVLGVWVMIDDLWHCVGGRDRGIYGDCDDSGPSQSEQVMRVLIPKSIIGESDALSKISHCEFEGRMSTGRRN